MQSHIEPFPNDENQSNFEEKSINDDREWLKMKPLKSRENFIWFAVDREKKMKKKHWNENGLKISVKIEWKGFYLIKLKLMKITNPE